MAALDEAGQNRSIIVQEVPDAEVPEEYLNIILKKKRKNIMELIGSWGVLQLVDRTRREPPEQHVLLGLVPNTVVVARRLGQIHPHLWQAPRSNS